MSFSNFQFDPGLLEGLTSMGFKDPTPIQAETIPLIQQKNDVIACAQTGTGKTAAYLLPVMDAICKMADRPKVSALILVPTRELAMQIDQQVEGLGYFAGVSSIAIYGGGDGMGYEQQRRALRDGVDLVIATPGRLIAHLSSGVLPFENLRFLVLDEADRMLDMGFKDDLSRIIRDLPQNRQTAMFSATMPPKIRTFAKTLLQNPEQVNIALSQPAEKINQIKYRTFDEQKLPLLTKILKTGDFTSIIVFASTKDKVKEVDKALKKIGVPARAFHSDLTQEEREALLLAFKNKQVSVLIGTDVLSRGIDVVGIDLVVNFDVPPDPEDYVHRIGRTARADKTGTAITFVNNRDYQRFSSIEELIGRELTETSLPEELGESPVYQPRKAAPRHNSPARGKKGSRSSGAKQSAKQQSGGTSPDAPQSGGRKKPNRRRFKPKNADSRASKKPE